MARLIQVPLELYGHRGKECLEPPRLTAAVAIAAVSAFGVLCLLVLTLMLMMQGNARI